MILSILLATLISAIVLGLLYYFFIYEHTEIYARAQKLAEEGNYIDARVLMRSRLDRNPQDPRAHYHISRLFWQEGDVEQELMHLLKVKELSLYFKEVQPQVVLGRIGEIYYQKNQLKEAFENFLELLHFIPDNESALAHVAFIAVGQAEFFIAERYFSKLVEIAPEVSEYHIGYGVCLSTLKRSNALSELELGYSQSPHNITAAFLAAFQNYLEAKHDRAQEIIERIKTDITDKYIKHIMNRLSIAVHQAKKDYSKALQYNEACLQTALMNQWKREIYDAHLGMAYLFILTNNLAKAKEHLFELEIQYPSDSLVMGFSQYCVSLEKKGKLSNQPLKKEDQKKESYQKFDFPFHMENWIKDRIPKDAIYILSGLQQRPKFNLSQSLLQSRLDKSDKLSRLQERQEDQENLTGHDKLSPDELEEIIDRFNSLPMKKFSEVCEGIINMLKFKDASILGSNEEGVDIIAYSSEKRTIKALFRIRRWRQQPISDIFLHEQESFMHEIKAELSFVIAGAQLTQGAANLLPQLKSMTVVNGEKLASLLRKAL